MSPLMKGQAKHYVGELVFSRTGCSGIVLRIITDLNDVFHMANYIVLWTIDMPPSFRVKEQLRDEESLRSK